MCPLNFAQNTWVCEDKCGRGDGSMALANWSENRRSLNPNPLVLIFDASLSYNNLKVDHPINTVKDLERFAWRKQHNLNKTPINKELNTNT